MKRILFALALILAPSAAFAQARVIGSTCGDLSAVGGNYTVGGMANLTQTTTGLACTNSGGGGGGGPVTGAVGSFVDGWNVTLGTKADAAWDGAASSATVMAYQRYIALNSSKPLSVTPKRLSALTTTPVQIGASTTGGNKLAYLQCFNPNASVAYVQVIDNATSPTLPASAGAIVQSFGIASTQTGGISLGTMAVNFSTAIWVVATTTAAGSAAPSTALDCNAGYF